MKNQQDRLKEAASDLQEIMEELEPYIRKPVVVEPTTKGRWVHNDGKGFQNQIKETERYT